MNPKQKLLFVFVALLGIAGLVFGIFQIKNNLSRPFLDRKARVANMPSIDENKFKMEAIFSLKKIDTDADGLSDFDEIYQYHTSAFLNDSDSDGIWDREELEGGTDPNCAKGASCEPGTVAQPQAEETPDEFSQFIASQSADFLRQNLLLQGVSADLLNQVSDQELEAMYQDMITENAGNNLTEPPLIAPPPVSSSLPAGVSPADQSALENLTPDELRQMLLENGMPKAQLDKLDDQTLMNIFEETLIGN